MFTRNKLNAAVLSVLAASTGANTYAEIDEIIVTATKRPESLQDVSIAIQAVTEETMDQLGVSNFDDYLLQLPGVTAGGSGPGQNTIYIRGVASTTPNLTTAGVAGLVPNVALYLDEQPLAQPGRNLDVYTADMSRVEVLAGPQGTLFGSSSQAGTVRLITNKPDHNDFASNIKLGTATVAEGDANTNLEVMVNAPLSDALAVRGVFYTDTRGGYIDNVAGTLDASESARFRAVRVNREIDRLRLVATGHHAQFNICKTERFEFLVAGFNDQLASKPRCTGVRLSGQLHAAWYVGYEPANDLPPRAGQVLIFVFTGHLPPPHSRGCLSHIADASWQAHSWVVFCG